MTTASEDPSWLTPIRFAAEAGRGYQEAREFTVGRHRIDSRNVVRDWDAITAEAEHWKAEAAKWRRIAGQFEAALDATEAGRA